ncbi:hypothetical protein RI367_002719 [Sorochytrium milnesiophthora]
MKLRRKSSNASREALPLNPQLQSPWDEDLTNALIQLRIKHAKNAKVGGDGWGKIAQALWRMFPDREFVQSISQKAIRSRYHCMLHNTRKCAAKLQAGKKVVKPAYYEAMKRAESVAPVLHAPGTQPLRASMSRARRKARAGPTVTIPRSSKAHPLKPTVMSRAEDVSTAPTPEPTQPGPTNIHRCVAVMAELCQAEDELELSRVRGQHEERMAVLALLHSNFGSLSTPALAEERNTLFSLL